MTTQNLEFILAEQNQTKDLQLLSTESLIIWIIGTSQQRKIKLTIEQITLECWNINPKKHSLRGYPQYPDSFVVMKRIFDMKGRKGLLEGTVQGGFYLTPLSQVKYSDIISLIGKGRIKNSTSKNAADRTISSMDEAPYKRLRNTPAYQKFRDEKEHEIVETDFLYFYGINWHSKPTFVESRIKNVDAVVKSFSGQDVILIKVHQLINEKFKDIKEKLLKHMSDGRNYIKG